MADPAYTRPPRDMQRAAVGKTFEDLMRDAQSVRGSVFDTPTDKVLREAQEGAMTGGPMSAGSMAGIIVPRVPKMGFTPAEEAAQALWGKHWPKLLEAFKNDTRAGGKYILDFINKPNVKGETIAPLKNKTDVGLTGPIHVRINPKIAGPETYPHEASHAFAFRRNQRYGGGNLPGTGGMEVLDPEVQLFYEMMGGDLPHAATYYRADEAAKRTGRVKTSGASLKDLTE